MENFDTCAKSLALSPWEAILNALESLGMPENSLSILKNVVFVSIENDSLSLEVENVFSKSWIQKYFSSDILKAANMLGMSVERLCINVSSKKNPISVPNLAPVLSKVSSRELPVQKKCYLAPTYTENTFKNFVEGSCNREALAMCRKVAAEPCSSNLNLLYIYGKSGLGKTHLLNSIAYAIKESGRNISINYAGSNQFLEDFLKRFQGSDSERRKADNEFREKYESVDVLLLDDVQGLSRKDKTQEELSDIIERRRLHGRQTVFTSDRLPSEMDQKHFRTRLLSKLDGCVSVKLDSPDAATRLGFVERRTGKIPFLEKERLEICRWIATPAVENFRVLIGKLNRLQAEHELQKNKLSLNFVRLFLIPGASGRTLEAIVSATASAFNVSIEEIISASRLEKVSFVRKIAMFICRKDTEESLHAIGEFFGRNHSTVVASCNSIEKMLEDNDDLAWRIQKIRFAFGVKKESNEI